MASLRRALPSLARCERPRNAWPRLSRDQPGRLAQGPEEKWILPGRVAGLVAVVMSLPFQIAAPRWGGVSRRGLCSDAGRMSRNAGCGVSTRLLSAQGGGELKEPSIEPTAKAASAPELRGGDGEVQVLVIADREGGDADEVAALVEQPAARGALGQGRADLDQVDVLLRPPQPGHQPAAQRVDQPLGRADRIDGLPDHEAGVVAHAL